MPTQSAFLKDRHLADSFVTASEIIAWYSKTKIECVGIKADFEKAFDSVRWSFLKDIMKWLGFNDKWYSWVAKCMCHTNWWLTVLLE